MRQMLLIFFFCLFACKTDVSKGFNIKSLQAELERESILTDVEKDWLSKYSDSKYTKDSIIEILQETFIQDFPAELRSFIASTRSITERIATYPSTNGQLFIDFSDNELDSIFTANKKFIDVLRIHDLIDNRESDTLKAFIEDRQVIFKFDLVNRLDE